MSWFDPRTWFRRAPQTGSFTAGIGTPSEEREAAYTAVPRSQTEAVRREEIPTKKPDIGGGWTNAVMGYGTSRDKLMYGYHAASQRIDDEELSSLFYSDDVAAKLVEKRPEEAFRRGYKLLAADETKAKEVFELGRALDLDAKMQEAWTWGRLYGGALLVIGAAGSPTSPLDEAKAGDVKYLNVVDRRFCHVKSYYTNPLAPNFGQPEIYTITGGAQGALAVDIHESRVIRFDGLSVDARKRQDLQGWTYSVLQRPYDVMRTFATAFQAAGVLTADASQAVFTMKGLFEAIASGEKKRLETRMQLLDMSRSSARAVLLDADGEKFERVRTEFSGLPEMLDRMMMRLASSVDMPVTILMGRSPAGQNATGDSDFKHWYDSIKAQQTKELSPKLLRVFRILSRGALKEATIEWCSLAEMTDKERAELEKLITDRYCAEIEKGVLYPQEVALARYGKKSNGQIVIDEKQRHEELKAEKDLSLNPPPPPPVVAPPNANGQPPTPPSAPAEEEDDADEADEPGKA